MKKNMPRIIPSAIMGVICLLFIGVQAAWAESNISDTYKYAWSENAGWHNWKATNGQATVGSTYLVGYVWAERIGWIKLGADAGGPYANTNATNWGVNRDVATGALSGYAWSENAGWVNFNPTHGGVTISTSTNKFDGYAWGERVGWIHFQNASPEYYVMQEAGTPTVTTQAVSNIGETTATGNGNVTALGAPHPTQHGVCWNTTGNPTIAGSKTEDGAVSETGAFASSMTGLSPNTPYYVRAYATNTAGTVYGDQVSFSTSAQTPTVTTQAVTDIAAATATGNGNITDLGAPNPTQHGVCWNTTGSPTIADSKTQDGAVSATGAFTSSMTGLSPNTPYYVRAYATNTAGTVYGDQVSFSTSAQTPTVTTQAVTDIAAATATGNGNITDLGAPNPTQHGVCWNTTGSPTIAGSKTQEGGVNATGPFSSNMTGLSPSTMYYVRAYATNTGGTAYGNEVYFRTACATIFYVSRDGNCEGQNPCYSTIQAAIDAANTGTCIRIEQGTYTESITLNGSKTVTLLGGWDASFKNQTANTTFIQAPKAPQGTLILQMLSIKP